MKLLQTQILFWYIINLSFDLDFYLETRFFNNWIQFIKIYHIFPYFVNKDISSLPVKFFLKVLKLRHYYLLIQIIRLIKIFLLKHDSISMLTNRLDSLHNRYFDILNLECESIKIVRVGHRAVCCSRIDTKHVLLQLPYQVHKKLSFLVVN